MFIPAMFVVQQITSTQIMLNQQKRDKERREEAEARKLKKHDDECDCPKCNNFEP